MSVGGEGIIISQLERIIKLLEQILERLPPPRLLS